MDIYAIVSSGFAAVYDYVLAHTLFCLVPAFFIAGAMAARRDALCDGSERLAQLDVIGARFGLEPRQRRVGKTVHEPRRSLG